MSAREKSNHTLSMDGEAFEYVIGTLSGTQRQEFIGQLTQNAVLQKEVLFWEEQLMPIGGGEQRAPKEATWDAIERSVSQANYREPDAKTRSNTGFDWRMLWPWATPSIAALGVLFVLMGYVPGTTNVELTTDYVAVLTSSDGDPFLTALTSKNDHRMWFKWEPKGLVKNTHAQLWAKSKRDGQIRPVSVIDSTGVTKITLTEATFRLISDAQSLLLTQEELGGSAIDEPSDIILASGVCVRLSQNNSI